MSMTFVLITLWYIIRVSYTKMFTWFFGYHHNVSIIILTMSMIWSRRREARNALGSSFVFETETETVRDQGTKGAKGHGGKGKLRFSADSGTEVWVVCGISSKCSIEMVGFHGKRHLRCELFALFVSDFWIPETPEMNLRTWRMLWAQHSQRNSWVRSACFCWETENRTCRRAHFRRYTSCYAMDGWVGLGGGWGV